MIPLYVFLLQAVLSAHTRCPPNYSPTSSGPCIVELGTASSFCGACEMCTQYGAMRKHLAFLTGKNAHQFTSTLSDRNNAWLGFNRFLTTPNRSFYEWFDVDPRTTHPMIVDPTIIRRSTTAHKEKPVVIFNGIDGMMYDFSATTSRLRPNVYCEYGGLLPTGSWRQEYREDSPMILENFIQTNPDFYGCYKEITAVSIVECAKKCTLNVACRSLYYGENTQRCVHMMYADALLPATFTSNQTGWKRLAKTSYPVSEDEK
ncbi:PAN domain protein, partial [Opisthorchis viverrini]